MKRLILLALLLHPVLAEAQGDVYRALFDGRAGALVSVEFGEKTLGTIDYDGGGEDELMLEGTTAPDGAFDWSERLWNQRSDLNRITGHYRGKLAADRKSGEGVWTSLDGRKKKPFTLARIGRARVLKAPDVNASASWPEFDDPRYAQLNRKLEDAAGKDLARQAQNLKQIRDELKAIDSEAVDRINMGTDCAVQSATANLVSLFCSEYEYLGGAHGNTDVAPRHFAIGPDGAVKPVGLWDLLSRSPEAERRLSQWLMADLRRQRASSVRNGDIKTFADALAQDGVPFTIVPAGLAFQFPPYAVGAYAEGAFEVLVPNKELAPFIRKDGPLAGRVVGR